MFLAFLEKSENLRENLKNVGYVQGGQVMDFLSLQIKRLFNKCSNNFYNIFS